MKRTFLVLMIAILAIGAMGFGRFMIGVVDDNVANTAIAIGTDIGPNMFAYGGLGFWPVGLTGGAGLMMGDLYSTDFGTTPDGKEIGKMKISYGGLASGSASFSYYTYFGAFAGPAVFFDLQIPLYSSNVFTFVSLGLSVVLGYSSPIGFGWSSGAFYVF